MLINIIVVDGVAQMVELLPSKCEALSSSPSVILIMIIIIINIIVSSITTGHEIITDMNNHFSTLAAASQVGLVPYVME
jgi:hypothetical protein